MAFFSIEAVNRRFVTRLQVILRCIMLVTGLIRSFIISLQAIFRIAIFKKFVQFTPLTQKV